MSNKTYDPIVRVCIVTLLLVGLFVSSCKKSPTESSSENSGQQQATNIKTTVGEFQQKADEPKSGMAPIDIKLPKPKFIGTPQNIQVPNLEKPLGKPRPPFYAPVGTENVALGKPVSSTDPEPIIGELPLVTDGDKEAVEGSYVELGPFLQNVTIDLQGEYNIYAILFWHFHKQARVYFDVVVQVADDPNFTTNVTTLFNNDTDNSASLGTGNDMHYVETAEGKLIDAKGVKARYVRLSSQGNNANELNHYTEVEVYGKPAK